MSLSGAHNKETKTVVVSIPETLHGKVERLIKEKSFESISEYVSFLLREDVSKYEEDQLTEDPKPDEVERIKQKLRNLGYLQ